MPAETTAIARSEPTLVDGFSSKLYFAASVMSWKPLHAVEHALAGAGPDVRHHRDDVQPVRDAVVGGPDVGLAS